MAEPLTQQATLVNELGMHLRAAGRFVQLAARYSAAISITYNGMTVDGKSIMGILSLAVACGQTISIQADGEDAKAALTALSELVAAGFEEGR